MATYARRQRVSCTEGNGRYATARTSLRQLVRGNYADLLEAEADGGIHRFTIADIQRIASPIYYETNAITVKTTEAKLIKMRIKSFGNRLYLKNPMYYVGDLSTADVTHDTEGILVNNVYVNNKAHVYQPLELK